MSVEKRKLISDLGVNLSAKLSLRFTRILISESRVRSRLGHVPTGPQSANALKLEQYKMVQIT